MAELTPRERRQQRTHDAILDTAIQLVRENGADNLSLREIARRIDYSPAGLYEYFGSKEEIIEAICVEGNLRLSRHLGQVDESLPFETYIQELARAYIQFAVKERDYFLLMFSRLTPDASDMSDEDFINYTPDKSDNFYYAYHVVERAIADDLIIVDSDTPLTYLAFGVWSMVHGLAMLRITHLATYPIDFEVIEQTTIKTFLRGLRKEP